MATLLTGAAASPASAASFLVYTSSSFGGGTLWDATDVTGVANPRPTISGLIDISFVAGGTLFGLGEGSNPFLYSINPVTGAATPIGTGIGLGPIFEGDLAYDPTSGVLYGFYELETTTTDCCVNLFTIDTTTGVATVVGAGINFQQSFVSMMSFDSAGNLWLINQLAGGTTLVRLDKTTGAVLSEVGIFGDSTNLSDTTGGMDFDPLTNTMYLANTVRWTIDTSTGQITALFGGASFAPDVRGLAVVPAQVTAPVPEPATLMLVGAGLAGAVARRRRKNRR